MKNQADKARALGVKRVKLILKILVACLVAVGVYNLALGLAFGSEGVGFAWLTIIGTGFAILAAFGWNEAANELGDIKYGIDRDLAILGVTFATLMTLASLAFFTMAAILAITGSL